MSEEVPLETTGNDEPADTPLEPEVVDEDHSASVKRDNPDDGIFCYIVFS